MDNNTSDILVLKFADAAVPEFKEVANKDYILYGKNNLYPEYLTYLYNKSSKHSAIVNGKAKYIFGSGLTSDAQVTDKLPPINKQGETWADISPRAILDVEIYGGMRLLIIWNRDGKTFQVFHCEFQKLRNSKEQGFWYKEDWSKTREEAIHYDEFDPSNPVGAQIYAYNEYRPGTLVYPLPEYIACNNYIETDIEISKFHLSAIKNGMMPSKMIQFFNGANVSDDKKADTERRWKNKFSGSENAGKFLLVFNSATEKAVQIDDLSASELDKQFDILNKTVNSEIFTGHQVTSPMLFGVKEEGQLGGNTELKTSYEVFINTYAKNKQTNYERIINYLNGFNGMITDYTFKQLDPVGLQFDISQVITLLPKEFIFEKLNIPKEYWGTPTQGITPTGEQPAGQVTETMVNDNIKNLSSKQHQQLMRIIRQYSKGQLTKEAATTLLKTGLGLNDDDIVNLLGVDAEAQFSEVVDEDGIIAMFSEAGDMKSDYHLIHSKKVDFVSDDEALDYELNFHKQSFATDVSVSEADILSLINKDKKVTPEVIASTLNTSPEYVTAKIAKLVDKGLLTSKEVSVGSDKVIERQLTKPLGDITSDLTSKPLAIYIKYSYEGPQDSRNRPFCARMIKLDRYYSRAEIESISQRLGYSVFDRRGGFWRHPDGITTPYCRHRWASHVLVKKGATAK